MRIPIPRELVDFILLGPANDRRQLQESPILGDVWLEFAKNPGGAKDVLIEPHRAQTAGRVAAELAERLTRFDQAVGARGTPSNIAYLQGIVAAHLTFEQLLCVIVPMTEWWKRENLPIQLANCDVARITDIVDQVVASARAFEAKAPDPPTPKLTPLERFVVLAGIVHWSAAGPHRSVAGREPRQPRPLDAILKLIKGADVANGLSDALTQLKHVWPDDVPGFVWQVSLNRTATPALGRSVPAVKGDAARTLFATSCKEITWAVLDSGIDADHPVFATENGSRVRRTFDFSKIRQIVSLDNIDNATRTARLDVLLNEDLQNSMSSTTAIGLLEELALDARRGRPVQWDIVEQFVEMKAGTKPYGGHGTHVAGIIGAQAPSSGHGDTFADGMCPDINLFDLRVLARSAADTEFAVIAALQYLRYLNDRHGFISVHGANLSLSIPHDVRNFACGRTPVCNECERLIDSGVVVVAAAGNRGYHSYETREGPYEGYAAFSVTDPGNADGVITVGSTHRYWPHTYGVSFFSSRGPTGDGRMKPDLVAPGERIQGPLPEQGWGQQDGTSMAAPHVSGAAAMLMARYSELIGQPRRIKRIICESATDLGRERSFQGSGMLDVLRAFQSI